MKEELLDSFETNGKACEIIASDSGVGSIVFSATVEDNVLPLKIKLGKSIFYNYRKMLGMGDVPCNDPVTEAISALQGHVDGWLKRNSAQ